MTVYLCIYIVVICLTLYCFPCVQCSSAYQSKNRDVFKHPTAWTYCMQNWANAYKMVFCPCNPNSSDKTNYCYPGLLVVVSLMFCTPYFYYIPKASLAAVIIAAVVFMVEVRVVKPIYRTKSELFLCLNSYVKRYFSIGTQSIALIVN